jgi:hypothetical protein
MKSIVFLTKLLSNGILVTGDTECLFKETKVNFSKNE